MKEAKLTMDSDVEITINESKQYLIMTWKDCDGSAETRAFTKEEVAEIHRFSQLLKEGE